MPRDYFTVGEITLCAYAAIHDPTDFGGKERIGTLTGRSQSSIDMKIRNFAAMLDEKGISRRGAASGLTGTPTGEGARTTNWDVVEPLTRLTQEEFLRRCRGLLSV